MHSSAFGAAALMAFRSFSSAARLSSLKDARYSSMVFGLGDMTCPPREVRGFELLLFGNERYRDGCDDYASVPSTLSNTSAISLERLRRRFLARAVTRFSRARS